MFKLIKSVDEVSEIRDIKTNQVIGYRIFIRPLDESKSIVDIYIPDEYRDKVEVIKEKSGVITELLVYEVKNLKDFLVELKNNIEVELKDNVENLNESFEI